MSRLWPHPPYAEDQPLHKTILATHVLTRGFQFGSILGTALGPPIYFLGRTNFVSQKLPKFSTAALPLTSLSPKSLAMTTINSAGVGALIGTAFLSVGLTAMMREKEEIEWKDRSWRLLENKFQVEVDDFTYSGATIGAISAVTLSRKLGLSWKGNFGVVALGGLGGLMAYFGWRYGIHGGKFDDKREKSDL